MSERNSVVDFLRGLASVSVCWFHLTNGNQTFLTPGILKDSGAFGWLGVEIFFVISGFIIPYALQRSSYQLSDYATFILKRIIRLDPPYLASIGIIISLGYAVPLFPGFRGEPYHASVKQILLHIGYINVFFGYPWLNLVFWSLAIELQYYVLIGLLYPAINSSLAFGRIGILILLALVAIFVPAPNFVFHWLPLFLMGIATFHYRRQILVFPMYGALLIFLGTVAIYTHGLLIGLISLGTACLIAFCEKEFSKVFLFFGSISYSLYLLHLPIGGKIVNFGSRFAHDDFTRVIVLSVAFMASVAASWILYKYVERPSQKWSALIGYKRGVAGSGFGPRSDKLRDVI
jgi:peptidoglycan/LPS O-acetylase OafA/YrhL